MAKKKKGKTPMEKLTEGYNTFIKGKEINTDGRELFEKAIKKTAIPKPRSVK